MLFGGEAFKGGGSGGSRRPILRWLRTVRSERIPEGRSELVSVIGADQLCIYLFDCDIMVKNAKGMHTRRF